MRITWRLDGATVCRSCFREAIVGATGCCSCGNECGYANYYANERLFRDAQLTWQQNGERFKKHVVLSVCASGYRNEVASECKMI
jgi:hypothetical protein